MSADPRVRPFSDADPEAVAERVREACILEALRAWEDAGISGLCHEGRFEAAVSALRMLDLSGCARAPAQGPPG